MKRLSILTNHLSTTSLVECEKRPNDKIAIVTLNRPAKFNALCYELSIQLNSILLTLDASPDVHVIILTGAGKNFCVGADVKIFETVSSGALSHENIVEIWYKVIPKLKKPIVAAINGLALGGGLEIAMMCDIIIAHKTSKMGQPEVKLAVIPGSGGTQRLTKVIGKYRAMHLLLTGDTFTAEEAFQYGLITKVAEKDVVEDAVVLASKIAKYPLPALKRIKKAVNASQETGLSNGLFTELQLFNQALMLNDKKEGVAALLEKRSPKFTNS